MALEVAKGRRYQIPGSNRRMRRYSQVGTAAVGTRKKLDPGDNLCCRSRGNPARGHKRQALTARAKFDSGLLQLAISNMSASLMLYLGLLVVVTTKSSKVVSFGPVWTNKGQGRHLIPTSIMTAELFPFSTSPQNGLGTASRPSKAPSRQSGRCEVPMLR